MKNLQSPKNLAEVGRVFICQNVSFLLTFSLLKVKKQKNIDLKREYIWDDCEENKLNEHKTRPNRQMKR